MSLVPVTHQAGNGLVEEFPQSVFSRIFQITVSRISDYAELCRPRIALMTTVAVVSGFVLASPVVINWQVLCASVLGIVMLVAASSIFNQVLERRTDSLMNRTSNRPLSQGRIGLLEVLATGFSLAAAGTFILWSFSTVDVAVATFATFGIYAFGYTLLKPYTSLCTTVGAIPGAMPPVLGWLAAGGHWGIELVTLFGLFFVWQFPHFLAIGWIHRKDYLSAGLRMLPSFRDNGRLTGILAVIYAVAFIPVSVLPSYVGLASDIYFVTASVASLLYLVYSVRFLARRTDENARRLMRVSLICLPVLLLTMVGEFVFLTSVR